MIITQRKKLQGILEYHIFVWSGTQYSKKYREKRDFTYRCPQAIEKLYRERARSDGNVAIHRGQAAGRTRA